LQHFTNCYGHYKVRRISDPYTKTALSVKFPSFG